MEDPGYTIRDVDTVLARKSMAHFVRQGWHVVEPDTPLIWNWHIDAICMHLEAAARGRIKRLLINIPPGHMKSLLVCVFWPAWIWTWRPGWRSMFGSYDLPLSTRDSMRMRAMVTSDWYQRTFRPSWKLKGDQNVKTWFENTAGGMRMALAVGGRGTGFRGDCVCFDDPLNVKRDPSETELENSIFWWDKRMSSRFNRPSEGVRVGIMQRLHENDLSGHIKRTKDNYVHLCLPTEFDPDNRCWTEIGFRDPRKKRGELLFPAMYDNEEIAEAKKDLGSYQFEGQHNQNPVPRTGGIIKAHWLRYWYPSRTPPQPVRVVLENGEIFQCPQIHLPDKFDYKFSSSDLAFKDKKDNSAVAMQMWGALGPKRFLVDQIHERMSFVKSLANFENLRGRHKGVIAHLVEDKANGPALMSVLESKVPDLIPIEPREYGGSKESRMEAASPSFEAGNVYVPHPLFREWAESYVQEITTFPKSRENDRADATSQAINWARDRGSARIDMERFVRL